MNRQQPLYPEIGVIALVPDQWSPFWQPRHYVLLRLAHYFNVVWVNCPHSWRQLLSVLRKRDRTFSQAPAIPPGLQIYQPEFWLPLIGRPAGLGRFTSRQRLKRAYNLLRRRGCTKTILYLWRPEFASALTELPCDLSVYHIDDEYSFSACETPISTNERHLLGAVDEVFIHSPALMDKKGHINAHTEFIPNGVDYHAHATPAAEPGDLRNISHPRVGYIGQLKQMLDWSLLLEISAQHSNWSFVFVGPISPHPTITHLLQQMSSRPNVYFLGAKRTEELGAYPQHFDVCIMPYKVDDYTRYIYPLKMHEYLASGRPVVSSPIRSVREFKDVIAIANTCDEWCSAIERALSVEHNSPQARRMRQEVAREHDWDALVLRIARIIMNRLHGDVASSYLPDSNTFSFSTPLPESHSRVGSQ